MLWAMHHRADIGPDPRTRSDGVRWGRPPMANPWISPEAADRTDRQVSQLISIGGIALILGAAIHIPTQAGDFPLWWECLAIALAAQILTFAAFGWILPMPVLRAGWISAPILNAVLLFSCYAVFNGSLPVTHSPWPWSLAATLLTYLTLTIPAVWAMACTIGSALLPLLSAVVFLGEVPQVLLIETPIQVANLIYIALFTGIRARLNRLRDTEARALAAEQQRVRALISARDKALLARLIHDEVLSVLAAATQFRGIPPQALRTNADLALALLERPALERESGPIGTRPAADRIAAMLRRVDADVAMDCTSLPGEVPCHVVETIGAAAAEALRNSVRHAAGAERRAEVSVVPDRIAVVVQDRGPGFDPDRVDDRTLGIRQSIIARTRALPGGAATVESAPGEGTRVLVTWQI